MLADRINAGMTPYDHSCNMVDLPPLQRKEYDSPLAQNPHMTAQQNPTLFLIIGDFI